MIHLKTFDTIVDSINRIKSLRKGYVTNFFKTEKELSTYIKKNKVLFSVINESFFLLIDNNSIYNLFYISTSPVRLSHDLYLLTKTGYSKPLVADIVTKDRVPIVKKVFEETNFLQYAILIRMSRLKYDPIFSLESNPHVNLASEEQSEEILKILNTNFDQKSEQLPDLVQILEWIKRNGIYTYIHEGKIFGLIIFEVIGITLNLRYWFVNPEFRDRKIGSILFKYFLYSGKETKRQLFWVMKSNENAIKRYKHFGFKEEDLFNYVMIYKQKYEK